MTGTSIIREGGRSPLLEVMRLEGTEEGKYEIFMYGLREVKNCANSSLTEENGKALEIERSTCLSIQMTSVVKMPLSFTIELSGDDKF